MLNLIKPIKLIELAKILGTEIKYLSNLATETINNYNEKKHKEYIENKIIDSVTTIDAATNSNQITFLANPLYSKHLSSTQAGAIIIEPKNLDKCKTNIILLLTNNPRLALAKLLSLCVNDQVNHEIHPSCTIGKNVKIGQKVNIEPGVVIGNNCVIGDRTIIKANVVLYDKVAIGCDCTIHSNTVIGSDGFGYAKESSGKWVKMPHLGGVTIEDEVEIGSNTSVDRGCIGDTIIKKGVIIDNLVQIAHNVVIGKYTAIAGCTAIAGSTIIGDNCLIGGGSSIAGHLTIADHVCITATSSVNKSLLKQGIYSSGLTVRDNLTWRKNIARFNCLDETLKKILTKIN